MFTILSIILALAALTHADCGYPDEPIYPIRSDPFNLILVSEDASLNGNTLSACHTGVTDASLCPTHSDGYALEPAVLYHNTSNDAITNVRIPSTLLPRILNPRLLYVAKTWKLIPT
jgi:hypothetical protein